MSVNDTNQPVIEPSSNLSIPTVVSDDLLKGSKTLIIRHGDSDYRLQLTRSQKLILTK